jgi:hypothetical protein
VYRIDSLQVAYHDHQSTLYIKFHSEKDGMFESNPSRSVGRANHLRIDSNFHKDFNVFKRHIE